MVYSGGIKKGETLDVDLKHNVISLDGRTVLRHDLSRGSEHKIYFMRSPMTEREPDVVIDMQGTLCAPGSPAVLTSSRGLVVPINGLNAELR